jgi:hypothetical protein
MPCHPARARELIRQGRAVRRFDRGLFYIRLLDREDGEVQPVACGIDPGSKKEALTVKSQSRTYLNLQADAVTWVKKPVEVRRDLRRARRYRKTPCCAGRANRSRGSLPPSTKARWQWKLRLCQWLGRRYPITCFIVEDIQAHCFGGRKWNRSFSPLQIGKEWFYRELGGFSGNRISLHRLTDGQRLCQNARPSDCKFLAFNSWRTRLLPGLKTGGSAA